MKTFLMEVTVISIGEKRTLTPQSKGANRNWRWQTWKCLDVTWSLFKQVALLNFSTMAMCYISLAAHCYLYIIGNICSLVAFQGLWCLILNLSSIKDPIVDKMTFTEIEMILGKEWMAMIIIMKPVWLLCLPDLLTGYRKE